MTTLKEVKNIEDMYIDNLYLFAYSTHIDKELFVYCENNSCKFYYGKNDCSVPFSFIVTSKKKVAHKMYDIGIKCQYCHYDSEVSLYGGVHRTYFGDNPKIVI